MAALRLVKTAILTPHLRRKSCLGVVLTLAAYCMGKVYVSPNLGRIMF